ncbi:cisA [Symbiodinium sp. CCMP2592]|nr:cisA [Symbiodinium sp. CCMP2592]
MGTGTIVLASMLEDGARNYTGASALFRAFCPTRPFGRPHLVSDATIPTSAHCVRRDHSDVRALCPTRPFRRPRFVSDATIPTSALCVRRDHSDVRALCPTRPFRRPRFVSDVTIPTSALCVRRDHSDDEVGGGQVHLQSWFPGRSRDPPGNRTLQAAGSDSRASRVQRQGDEVRPEIISREGPARFQGDELRSDFNSPALRTGRQGVGPCSLRGPVPWKVPNHWGVPRATLDVRALCPTQPFGRPRFVSDATIRTSALCVRRNHSDVRALCPTQPFGRPRFVSDATIRTSALCVRRNHSDVRAFCPTQPFGAVADVFPVEEVLAGLKIGVQWTGVSVDTGIIDKPGSAIDALRDRHAAISDWLWCMVALHSVKHARAVYARIIMESVIRAYTKRSALRLNRAGLFEDIGVSGTTPVQKRPGFVKMLDYAKEHNINKIIFEDASRLARCVVVQELALSLLRDMGFSAISASNPDHFLEDDSPHTTLVRQLIGSISEFHRSETVTRLKKGRDINLQKSMKVTMQGSPKLGGKPNRLEGKEGKVIKGVIRSVLKDKAIKKGDLAKICEKLFQKGISTAKGKVVSHSQASTWANAVLNV